MSKRFTLPSSLVYLTMPWLIFTLFWSGSAQGYTRPLSSETIINESDRLNGRRICFRGEVVGDLMMRGKCCWINLNDGPVAIGIYCQTSLIPPILYIGDYKHTGDILEVSGIFHKACSDHTGELDIHAERIRIIERGDSRYHPVNKLKIYTATLLALITCLTLLLYYLRKKRLTKASTLED